MTDRTAVDEKLKNTPNSLEWISVDKKILIVYFNN